MSNLLKKSSREKFVRDNRVKVGLILLLNALIFTLLMTYYGKYLEEVRFRFTGDQEKAKLLILEGRKYLGMLVNDAGFNRLDQLERRHTLADGSVIDVKMYAGLKEINIYVPPKPEGEAMDVDIITGFIVEVVRTSHINDESILLQPWVIEPGNEEFEDPGMTFIGQPVPGPWIYVQEAESWNRFDKGNTPNITSDWEGFNVNGFAKRLSFFNAPNPPDMFCLSLNEITYDYDYTLPASGPRVITLEVGMDQYQPNYVRYEDPNIALAVVDDSNAERIAYSGNVDFVNDLMKQGYLKETFYQIGPNDMPGTHYMSVNSNDLFAVASRVRSVGDGSGSYHILSSEAVDFGAYGTKKYTANPYGTVALFPGKTKVFDDGGILLPQAPSDPLWQYDINIFLQNYQDWAQRIFDSGVTLPYSLPRYGTQDTLYPPVWIHPLEAYLIYPLTLDYNTSGQTSKGTLIPKFKTGYYRVHIPAYTDGFFAPGSDGFTSASQVNDVHFDLEITLFGSKTYPKLKLKGVSGVKNTKIGILVGVPMEFRAGHPEELLGKIVTLGN